MSRQTSCLLRVVFAITGIVALPAVPRTLSPLIEAQSADLVPPGVWSGEMSGTGAINETTFGPNGQWRIYRQFDRKNAKLLIRTGRENSKDVMFGVIFFYSDFDAVGDEDLAQHFEVGYSGGEETAVVALHNAYELPGDPIAVYGWAAQTFHARLKPGQRDFSLPFRFSISSCPDAHKNEAEYDDCLSKAKTEYQPHINPMNLESIYAAKTMAGASFEGKIQGRFEGDTATGTWEANSDWGNSISGTWKVTRLGTSAGTDSLPWQIVPTGLGGLAASAVLITAIANILAINRKKRTEAKKPDQDPDEVVGYVLQLSADTVTVSSQQPGQLSAAVWQVMASGATRAAMDASIEVDVPAWAVEFLRMQPISGTGRIDGTLSITKSPASQEVSMTVRASGPKGGASATVKIMVQLDYDIDFL